MSENAESRTSEDLKQLVDLITNHGVLLAMLPIEDVLETFRRADTLGPILEPTRYRDYLFSGRGDVIKDILEGALKFKQAIVRAQQAARENPRLITH